MMSSDLTKYENTLKFAFSRVYGGASADWTAGAETSGAEGQAMREFKNEKQGILLQVTGMEEGDCGKFSATRVDAAAPKGADADRINLSIPKSWLK
jgi:hypothetical protein